MNRTLQSSEHTVIFDDFRISAGGVLIDEEEAKVCIIRSIGSDEYLLPKGGKEANETLAEAARREVFEETGYENRIFPDKLLGIHFRPQVGGRAGEQKVIFWFYSEVTNLLQQEGTGEEYEDFCSEWFSLESAIEKLDYEEDRVLVQRAYGNLTSYDPRHFLGLEELWRIHADRLVEFRWTDDKKKGFRLLTSPSTEIVKGFAVVDSTRKRILLSLDRDDRSWNLPTEKIVKYSEVFDSKLGGECSPFLFELTMNRASEVIVTQWFLLEWVEDVVEDSQFFVVDEAVIKLENKPAARVVKSIFSKLEGKRAFN